MKRFAIPLLALVLSPLLLGAFLAFWTLSNTMIHKKPLPLATSSPASTSGWPSPKSFEKGRLNALILLSNEGTEIMDAFAPYEILSASGLFNVFTAAPERTLSPTTGDLAVLPDYALSAVGTITPEPDLLVVPAFLDSNNPILIDWIRLHASKVRLVLAPCEGARLVAEAGLLKNRRATTHFMALQDLIKSEPTTHWIQNARVVQDGNIITTAGVTGSIEGTLWALDRLSGTDLARKTANSLGLPWVTSAGNELVDPGRPRNLDAIDLVRILVQAGYRWDKPQVAAVISPGLSELVIAAALDTYPRTFGTVIHPVSPAPVNPTLQPRQAIQTRDGLVVVADKSVTDYPEFTALDLSRQTPGTAIQSDLTAISLANGPDVARFAAKSIESSWTTDATDQRGSRMPLWYGPLIVGLGSAALAWVLVGSKVGRKQT